MRRHMGVMAALLVAVLPGCNKEKPRTFAPIWRQTSPLSVRRQGVAVVQVNGVLYALGGADGKTFHTSTEFARIQKDGSVGPWQPGPPMHEPRGYFAAVAHDGFLYALAGGNGEGGKTLLRTVERARILPDGSLSPWVKEKHAMVTPRRCAKAVLVGDTIYAIGGFGGDMLDNVEHAKLLPGGGTDEWLEEAERTVTMRYISGVKAVDGTVYVTGNHDQTNGSATPAVEWSRVVDEAGFGKWQATEPMLTPRFGHGLVPHKGRLYVFGGLDGPEFLDTIESAVIRKEGGVEPWKAQAARLSNARAMMGYVSYQDWVYAVGGTGQSTVEYATFNEAGDLGSWVTAEELKAIESQRQRPSAEAELPLGGTVLKVMHAPPWVYLQVDPEEADPVWIAGPAGAYQSGDRVRFGKGALMHKFVSKQLNTTFDEVLFVSQLRKVQ